MAQYRFLMKVFVLMFTILLGSVRADVLFREGFFDHDTLPGGANDELNRPNTPFSTETNRFADGAQDNLAPRFAVYKGAAADVSDRHVRHKEYLKSCAEQGISSPGSGDRIKEIARHLITSQANYKDLPAPTKTFPVLAAIKWNPSDFAIQAGETYNISVLGDASGYSTQFWNDGTIRVNSEGYESHFDSVSNCYVGIGRCRPFLKKRRRLVSANWMSLACAIGQFVRPLHADAPVSDERFSLLPLDESALLETVFSVGSHVQFRSKYTGQLICFANDAHSQYWNNYGQLEVTAVRVSWPPSDANIYQQALLPLCARSMIDQVNYNLPPCVFYQMQ